MRYAMTLDESLKKTLEKIEAMLAVLVERQQEWFSIEEFARMIGKAQYTVRQWARLGRIRASKRLSGRGAYRAWCVHRIEIARYQREGLVSRKDAQPAAVHSR